MKNTDWDMRVCLFAAYSLSLHLSVRVASAYAPCSNPSFGGAARNKHVVVLHDAYLRYHNSNTKVKSDGYGNISDDLNRAFSEVFELGISCESEYVAPKDQESGRVTLSNIVDVGKVEQARLANRASSMIIVVLWSFQEVCKTDQSYSKIVSMMDVSEGHKKVSEPLNVLDGLSRTIANLVLVGPGNPDLYELLRSGQMASQLSTLFERAWTASTSRTFFLSIPIEYVLKKNPCEQCEDTSFLALRLMRRALSLVLR